jgi:hypothetical protein
MSASSKATSGSIEDQSLAKSNSSLKNDDLINGSGNGNGTLHSNVTLHENQQAQKQIEDIIQAMRQAALNYTVDHKKASQAALRTFDFLPSSSIWCQGSTLNTRICKFRNLCYNPRVKRWFIVKTNSTVYYGMPENHFSDPVIEVGSVENHPWTAWSFDAVSPYLPQLQNIVVRYETDLTIMFKRLHPLNIMHNLHDDVIY